MGPDVTRKKSNLTCYKVLLNALQRRDFKTVTPDFRCALRFGDSALVAWRGGWRRRRAHFREARFRPPPRSSRRSSAALLVAPRLGARPAASGRPRVGAPVRHAARNLSPHLLRPLQRAMRTQRRFRSASARATATAAAPCARLQNRRERLKPIYAHESAPAAKLQENCAVTGTEWQRRI